MLSEIGGFFCYSESTTTVVTMPLCINGRMGGGETGEKERGETCMLSVEEKPVCAQYIGEIVQEHFIHVKNTTPTWLPNSVRPSMISM